MAVDALAEFQSDVGEATTDRLPHPAGLTLGHAVDHHIVCEAFEPDPGELPNHPQIEAVVQKQVGDQRGDRATLWRPLHPLDQGTVGHQHRGFQPAFHIQQDPSADGRAPPTSLVESTALPPARYLLMSKMGTRRLPGSVVRCG
jgi:hypothetical protein